MRWIEDQQESKIVESLSQKLNISIILSRFIVSTGIKTTEEAQSFLDPKLAHFTDPFEIKGMLQAVERICEALKQKETILLVGDYDVDGITSTVIIKKNLTKLGSNPFHVIPKRKTEGYGLSEKVLKRGLKMGEVDLVIALDCGTNSSNEAKYLEERGIDLIVVDHHQSKEKLPSNAILVNPHLSKDHGEPWRFLCTAGLAFKLIHGMLKKLRQDGDKVALELSPKESIGLSGLGTIADLVPLKNENRILANFGLKYLSQQSGIGVQALLKEAKVENTSLVGEDVAFKIAPRINACGRLDDPDLAISLLLETDPNNCRALAKKMNEYNEERKSIESNLSKEALNQANNLFSEKPAVVACGEGDAWNPGVVGIVAGKLAHSLCKPCIVLARSESEYKGSGRGVAGVNLMNILNQCKELLTHWGGHPAAVGLSLNEENLEKFKKSFVECVEVETNGKLPEPSLKIAVTIKESELQDSLIDDLNKLAPFGQENPEPILALKNILLTHEPKKVGSGNHFQFSVFNGVKNITGIAWNMSENMPSSSTPLDLAFKLRWNHWNGRKTPQMVLEDWKLSA